MSEIEFAWVATADDFAIPIYMGRPYQALFAGHDCSETRVLKFTSHGANAYLPVLVRDLGGGQKEAYSAYGYGGMVGDLTLSDTDVASLQGFLSDASILALFIRHSPFLANHKRWPNRLVELNRHTYSADLNTCSCFDTYLKGLPQKLRWSINYARRAGLEVSFRPLSECSQRQINVFYRLYSELMQQKQTSAYYMFTEEFFLDHARTLGKYCELAEIVDPDSGNLLAGALFLLDETGWVHYHLSAATRTSMKLQGMELLLASAMYHYGSLGYKSMHLGGGHALDESDGLSRFKSKFADSKLNFSCTKLVCKEVSYQAERARLPLKHPGFFLISDARGA